MILSGRYLLLNLMKHIQIMEKSGMTGGNVTQLPEAVIEKVESVGMLESIRLL